LAFTFATSLAAGVVFGFAASLQASRTDLNLSLKEGRAGVGGRRSRLRSALVVSEVAAALMLSVGAGLMIHTLWQLRHTQSGFLTKNVLTMEVELPWQKYEGTQAAEFYRSVLDRVNALHGVESAAFVSHALGRHISQGGDEWSEIVGVIGDIRFSKLSSDPLPEIYHPLAQEPRTVMWLAVHTTADPLTLIASVRSEIQALDRDVPMSNVTTMDERVSSSLGTSRFLLWLLITFAGVATVLASVGGYAMMSYAVAQRTHEIGVRIAVGAQGEDILALVVGQGLRLALLGVAIGLVGSFAVTHVLSSFLYGVSPADPTALGAASTLMAGVVLVASYIPARHAAKLDPCSVLRQ
jgi:cell division protein FtsX